MTRLLLDYRDLFSTESVGAIREHREQDEWIKKIQYLYSAIKSNKIG